MRHDKKNLKNVSTNDVRIEKHDSKQSLITYLITKTSFYNPVDP